MDRGNYPPHISLPLWIWGLYTDKEKLIIETWLLRNFDDSLHAYKCMLRTWKYTPRTYQYRDLHPRKINDFLHTIPTRIEVCPKREGMIFADF
jgi:hypothetical protein